MALYLDFKLAERLYLSNVSRQGVVRAPFILKLSWYLVVSAKGGCSKSRLLVLQPWKRCACLNSESKYEGAIRREDTFGLKRI